jgi:hypothetical protein
VKEQFLAALDGSDPVTRSLRGQRRLGEGEEPHDEDAHTIRPGREARHVSALLERLGLVDQHDGDAVAYFVAKAADGADELVLFRPVVQLAFTLRADQDF